MILIPMIMVVFKSSLKFVESIHRGLPMSLQAVKRTKQSNTPSVPEGSFSCDIPDSYGEAKVQPQVHLPALDLKKHKGDLISMPLIVPSII